MPSASSPLMTPTATAKQTPGPRPALPPLHSKPAPNLHRRLHPSLLPCERPHPSSTSASPTKTPHPPTAHHPRSPRNSPPHSPPQPPSGTKHHPSPRLPRSSPVHRPADCQCNTAHADLAPPNPPLEILHPFYHSHSCCRCAFTP